jgi:Thiolase, N-terminal domain
VNCPPTSEAFICNAIRTPIGRYGGALSAVRPDDLAAVVLRELLTRNPGLDAKAIDDVILGCANQAGEDNRNVARMGALIAQWYGARYWTPAPLLQEIATRGIPFHGWQRFAKRSQEPHVVDGEL